MGDATAHVVQILFIVAANPRIFSNPEKLGQFDRAFAQRVRRAFVGVNEDRILVLPKCNADVAKPQTDAAEIGHIGKFLFGFGCVERNHGVRLIARIDRASIGMMQAGVRLMVEVTRFGTVFLHFDDPDGGESVASVGFKNSSDEPAAAEWKKLYAKFFPFRFMPDNFTADEASYYGYKYTITTDAEFLIEFGDLNSVTQARWMKPRLKWMGALLAHFLSQRTGKGNVPLPDSPVDVADPHSEEERDIVDLHIAPTSLPKRLPDYAREILNAAAGVPWQKAALMPQFNAYHGIMPDSFCVFQNLGDMPLDDPA